MRLICTTVPALCSTIAVICSFAGASTMLGTVTVSRVPVLGRYKKGDVSVLNEFMPGGGTADAGRTPGGSTPTPAATGTRACLNLAPETTAHSPVAGCTVTTLEVGSH